MTKVFISYRRDDSAYAAHAIYKKLIGHYGEESVVFDVDTIPLGIDFVEHLIEEVSNCDVLLAVIGDLWLEATAEDGRRRLENARDFVRVEIQAALKRRIPVIPVLVGKASAPSADQLPHGIKSLSRRNAAEVRPGRDFDSHLNRLVRGLDVSLQGIERPQRERTPDEEMFEQARRADEKERHLREAEQASPPTKRAAVTAAPPASHGGEQQIVAGTVVTSHGIGEKTGDIITNTIRMQLKLIPEGGSLMGSPITDDEASDRERPEHRVRINKPFYLGVYPVTQQEYEQITGATPSHFENKPRCPVDKVSWFDAIEFCNRLSDREELSRYYERSNNDEVIVLGGNGYRLPTEAEWEYACRAGSKMKYYFGDQTERLGEYAWFKENSDSCTHPVGEKQPNDWGLHDMHGNVWEWCWDWLGENYYDEAPEEDPLGPSTGSDRVYRGGSWRCSARYCRSACRDRDSPSNRYFNLGFRVALSSV